MRLLTGSPVWYFMELPLSSYLWSCCALRDACLPQLSSAALVHGRLQGFPQWRWEERARTGR